MGSFLGVLLATVSVLLPTNYVHHPLVTQETDYSCGAASTLSVLKYWGAFSGNEKDLYKDLQTNRSGTSPGNIEKVLKDYGLEVSLEENVTERRLRKELKNGTSIILDLQAWRTDPQTSWKDLWDDGHYVVAVAIDKTNLYVMDPSTPGAYAYLPLSELKDRWHDCEGSGGVGVEHQQLAIFAEGSSPDKTYTAPRRVERMD